MNQGFAKYCVVLVWVIPSPLTAVHGHRITWSAAMTALIQRVDKVPEITIAIDILNRIREGLDPKDQDKATLLNQFVDRKDAKLLGTLLDFRSSGRSEGTQEEVESVTQDIATLNSLRTQYVSYLVKSLSRLAKAEPVIQVENQNNVPLLTSEEIKKLFAHAPQIPVEIAHFLVSFEYDGKTFTLHLERGWGVHLRYGKFTGALGEGPPEDGNNVVYLDVKKLFDPDDTWTDGRKVSEVALPQLRLEIGGITQRNGAFIRTVPKGEFKTAFFALDNYLKRNGCEGTCAEYEADKLEVERDYSGIFPKPVSFITILRNQN